MTQQDFEKILEHILLKLEADTADQSRLAMKQYLIGYINGILLNVTYKEKQ